ncbi:MAG: TonB family protein [Bacteroidia bacterium]|nr:TonB family protein [Bacteroidia bacterium]
MNTIRLLLIFFLIVTTTLKSESQIKKLALKHNGKKYGYVNNKGKKIIPYKYTYAEPFSEGFAVVENEAIFHFIDTLGQNVFNKTFYDAWPYSEGLACVSINKKYGFINNKGEVVIDYKYDYAESFLGGKAIVRKYNPDTNKYGTNVFIFGIINSKDELLGDKWFSSVYKSDSDTIYVTINKDNYILTSNGSLEFKSTENKSKYLIIDSLEIKPEYPGGEIELLNRISHSVKYPESLKSEGIQGKVFVQFIINKNGNVTDVSIYNPAHPLLNKESIRVIKALPIWKPGIQNGKEVKVSFIIPINYRLY